LLLAQRALAAAKDLESTDDAPGIATINGCKRDRIARSQFIEQRWEGDAFQFRAEVGVGRWRFSEAMKICLEIKSGASAENRQAAPLLNLRHGLPRQADKLSGVKGLIAFANVQQMMRNPGAFFAAGLGGAHVEAAINLHRIDADDFALHSFGQEEGHFRFADGRWACEAENE
jgi:hypothetical protein